MKRNRKNGLSAIEFLFVIVIAMIALAIAIQIFTNLHEEYKILISYFSSFLKGREAIDLISKDCRIAIRVMDTYAGYTTDDSTLVLKAPSIDTSRNIIDVNNEFDYIIYRLETGDLWKTVIPGSKSARLARDEALKKSIDSLYIMSKGTPLSSISHKSSITQLTLRVAISEIVRGEEYEINPGTTVKLMNYEWEFVR